MLDQIGLSFGIIAATLVIWFSSWILKHLLSPKGLHEPPSPPGIPFLGHLHYAGKNLFKVKCMEWAKEYGPVFRIRLGAARLVILNDIDSVKKYYSQKAVLHRPPSFLLKIPYLEGVGMMNGQLWVDNRRLCMHLLRNVGYGKEPMQKNVMAEVQYLVETISSDHGRPINFRNYIAASMSNIITMFVFGERYPFDDPRKKLLDETYARYMEAMEKGNWIDIFPGILKKLVAFLPFATQGTLHNFGGTATDFMRKEIKRHKETVKEKDNWDFIDHYLEKIKETEGVPNSSFTESYLIGNIINLFMGGTVSAISNIHYHMLNCAHNKENIQTQMQEEIDRVIGRDRPPSWEDRQNMPFTMAVIFEMLRCKPSTTLPRGAAEDIVVDQHFIPKGTMILRNTWALNMSPELWKDPETFCPARFLSRDGSELLTKPENFIPFSYGKRMCPAETLGMMQLFFYVTTLLQKFRVLKEEGNTFNIFHQGKEMKKMLKQKLVFLKR